MKPHAWRTRRGPFAAVWDAVTAALIVSPGIQVTLLIRNLRCRYPSSFKHGQLRT